MNLPIDKEYNNIYSFSKLSETDTDEDRIKQHLYYDYTRVNGFQFLSSINIEKTINLGFDLELNINYDVDYSEIIKYNYCVLQDKKFGTYNLRKKYFYFISNISQSNSAGKYKITLQYDYWSNNIATIYLNNFENAFNFIRKTNSPKYFPFEDGNDVYIETLEDYKLSATENILPVVSKKAIDSTINKFGYTVIFAKILLKGLSDSKYYKFIEYNSEGNPIYSDFNCSDQYLPTQFILLPIGVHKFDSDNLLNNAKVAVKSKSPGVEYTFFDTNTILGDFLQHSNVNEYVSMIELTSIVPFIDSGIIESVDINNNTFYLNSYFFSAQLASSDNIPISEFFNCIFTNYFNIGSCQRNFIFNDGNIKTGFNKIPKIVEIDKLPDIVIETNRYPYRFSGLQIGATDYPFYSGHGKAKYDVTIKGTGISYVIKYNAIIGDKELNPSNTGNFPSKESFFIPFYGDRYVEFMLGNKNQLENYVNQVQISAGEKAILSGITAAVGVAIGNIPVAVGGLIGAGASISHAIVETINAQNSIDSKISDSKQLLNNLKGNSNGLVSIFTSNVPIFYTAKEFDEKELYNIAYEIYTKGSKYNGVSSIKDVVKYGKYYNYIQTNVEILPFNSVDKISLAELTKIFNKGVRIWNINEAEYKNEGIYIDETFATMNLLIFNYREKEN